MANEEGITVEAWAQSTRKAFSKEKEFDETILPLINQLASACEELGLPIFMRILVAGEEDNFTANTVCNLGKDPGILPESMVALAISEEFSPNDVNNIVYVMKAGAKRKFEGQEDGT